MSFSGKVVIVTGAGRGICAVIAANFAEQGAKVVIVDRAQDRIDATVKSLRAQKREVLGVATDVGDEASVQAMVEATLDRWERIDILVNGAGSYGQLFRRTHKTPVEEWDHVFASNLKGSFLCAKHVIPAMLKQKGGRIINIASNAGRSVSPLLGASYTSAKTGVVGLTRHLAHEYAKDGILVNTIAPGPVDSDRVTEMMPEGKATRDMAAIIPLGRLAQPQDIANAVLFIASERASFITGAILDVNGGLVLA